MTVLYTFRIADGVDFFLVSADTLADAFARLQQRMQQDVIHAWVNDGAYSIQVTTYPMNPLEILRQGISATSVLENSAYMMEEYILTIQNKTIVNVGKRSFWV